MLTMTACNEGQALTHATDGMAGFQVHSSARTQTQGCPIILIIGPPGCGKGTLCKRLVADYNVHHLSLGDWLREQAKPPIVGVPPHINQYVSDDVPVPEHLLIAEYGSQDNMPAGLTLYQCGKLNVPTPDSMKIRAMPALKADIDRIASSSDAPKAILIDGLSLRLSHAQAAEEVFGAGSVDLVISISCSDVICKSRYLGRGRGSDDAARFDRRIASFHKENGAVLEHYMRASCLVDTQTDCSSEQAYENLLEVLDGTAIWRKIGLQSAKKRKREDSSTP